MKLVCDEGVERQIIDGLRAVGHEVIYVAELAAGISDDDVLSMATEAGLLLVTSDKDFGELVFRMGRAHQGVMLDPLDLIVAGGAGVVMLGRALATTVARSAAVGEIRGFTRHGINQVINRGVRPGEILEAVRNSEGIRAVDEFGRASLRFVGEQATVVINKAGQIITAWRGGWGF